MKKFNFCFLFLTIIFSTSVFAFQIPLKNLKKTITIGGATVRVQLDNFAASYCTIQASASNAGDIYVGGSTVTNSSGANQGLTLQAGESIANIRVNNAAEIYLTADNSGDVAFYACN